MRHKDSVIISMIISELDILKSLINGIDETKFLEDEILKGAVSMTLINIGELVKALSEDIKKENNNIPWRQISGLGDIPVHKYQTLKIADIWLTVKTDIPFFHEQLNKLI